MSDSRRCVIAKIYRQTLAHLLSGRVGYSNFPADGAIQAMVVDMASDAIMIRIESETFPVVPQFERIPDFDLRVDVLVSAANPS